MPFSLTIQEVSGKTTMTTVQIKATVYRSDNWAKKNLYIRWTYSPTAQFNNKVTRVDTFVKDSQLPSVSHTFDFSNLKPNTGYIIEGELLESRDSTDILAVGSTPFATLPIGGTFDCPSRSSSVITMALTGLNPLTFNAEARLRWKKSTDADTDRLWKEVDRQTISKGETKDLTHMFTGLTQATSYDFKCEVYDTDTNRLVATYTKTTSTLIYSGIIGEVAPSIKEVITVPLVHKGFIKAEVSDDLPDGCTIHLYKSADGASYTDLGAMPTDLLDEISNDSSGNVYYKLAVVDGNGNKYNETEPLRVYFPPFFRSIAETGQRFRRTASEMRGLANAILSLYKYIDTMLGGVPAFPEEYNALVEKMGTLQSGSPVEGDENSGFWLTYFLANDIVGGQAISPKSSGDPITADDFNHLGDSVENALNSIDD